MNNIPKEIIIKRKDFETMPQMIIVVVYVMIFITFLFSRASLLAILFLIGSGILGFPLFWIVPKLFKENVNEVFFSVQEWGITVIESDIRYRLEWWQIKRLYEKKEQVWIITCSPTVSQVSVH